MSVILRAEGLSKRFRLPKESLFAPVRHTQALSEVDLEVHEGETFGIIGESGSGKSTLVRLLLALSTPSGGTVHFDGRPVRPGSAASLRWLRRQTGIVLQDPYGSLDPRLRIGQIVAEPLQALRIAGSHRDAVHEVLARVGLESWRAEQYPHELSGGQRQRVALARAIVHRPRLLVGDEATSALDVTVRAQILGLLGELQRELGLTTVLVSHDLGLVQHLSERVAVMQDGRIVETGVTAAVLAAPAHPYTRRLLAAVPRLVDDDEPAVHVHDDDDRSSR